MCCSAEGWGKRSCWSSHHHIHPQSLSTTHMAKNQWGDGLGHLVEVRALLIYTSTGSGLIITICTCLFLHHAKWRWKDGKQNHLRTKCSWKNMHDTHADTQKHLDKLGRSPRFSASTLAGAHWDLTMAVSCGNTTALVIQAVRLETLTSALGGWGEMTPLFLLSIEIKPCATKGKRMQRSPRCVSNHSSVFK